MAVPVTPAPSVGAQAATGTQSGKSSQATTTITTTQASPGKQGAKPATKKPEPRMITGEQLVKSMGRAPHQNVTLGGFTLREMGTGYKAVLQALDDYRTDSRTTRFSPDPAIRKMDEGGLAGRLDKIEKAAADHLRAHPGDEAMQKLRDSIKDERQLLAKAAQNPALADPKLNNGQGYSFHEAMEAERKGRPIAGDDRGSLDISVSRFALNDSPGGRDDVLGKLGAYRDALATTRLEGDPVLRKTDKLNLERALDKLTGAVDTHLKSQPDDRAVQKLKGQLATERQNLQSVAADQAFATPGLNRGKGYTFLQAMELQRFGIAPGPRITFDEVHTDQQIKKTNESFASGNLNTVARIEYTDGQTKILKPEAERAGNGKTDGKMGISTDQPHYGNRNIATRVVDEFLGTQMTTNAQYAIHNGRLHLIMDQAPGVSSHSNATVEHPVAKDDPINAQVKWLVDGAKPGLPDPTDVQEIAAKHKVKITINAGGSFHVTQQSHVPYAINYENPDLARAMCNKELIDYITGQGDRHAGNYFIDMDSSGRLQGSKLIDDDSSFGTWDDPEAILQARQQQKFEGEGYNGIGMPLLFDKASVDRLRAPNAWQTLEADLRGLLTPAELAAAKTRFDKLLAHVDDPTNSRFVIADWTARTLPPEDTGGSRRTATQFLLDQPEKSYLGRDNRMLQHKIDLGIKPAPLPR